MSYGANPQCMGNRPVEFGQRISACLRTLRYSAKEIARSVGTTQRTVENWRAETTNVPVEKFLILCAQYEEFWVEVCDLTGRRTHTAEQILDELTAKLRAMP